MPAPRNLLSIATFTTLAAVSLSARAQTPALDEQALRTWVSQQVAAAPGVTRLDVQLGTVEPRPALATCTRWEPFTPAGSRLWGRASVGLRCIEGANGVLLVPVNVRAWGPAVVAAAPLLAGSVIGRHEVTLQEIELTREGASVLRSDEQLAGRTLTRTLAPGQALRAEMLRATYVVQAGETVRLRLAGPGFTLTGTGQALGNAADGETLRVRTDLGRVLSGTAREGRTVDVAL